MTTNSTHQARKAQTKRFARRNLLIILATAIMPFFVTTTTSFMQGGTNLVNRMAQAAGTITNDATINPEHVTNTDYSAVAHLSVDICSGVVTGCGKRRLQPPNAERRYSHAPAILDATDDLSSTFISRTREIKQLNPISDSPIALTASGFQDEVGNAGVLTALLDGLKESAEVVIDSS